MSLSQRIAAEERIARRVGVRKHDLLLIRLTCPDCARPVSSEERLTSAPPRTIDALEGWVVNRLLREPVGDCARCATDRAGRWRRSAILMRYCERRLAHLLLQVSLTPETRPGRASLLASSTVAGPPDGADFTREDVRVRVSMHWKVLGDTLQPITIDHPALRCLADDDALREALHREDPGERLQALRHLAGRHPEDAAIPREVALLLLQVGHYEAAAEAMEVSLALAPRQPHLLRLSAALCRTRRDFGPALERCMEAWELAPEAENLPDLVTTALRAGHRTLARSAATDLLEEEGDENTILAEATLALLEGARDPEGSRQAWEALARSARIAGDAARREVAAHTASFWSLHLPAWPADMDADTWREQVLACLREADMWPPDEDARQSAHSQGPAGTRSSASAAPAEKEPSADDRAQPPSARLGITGPDFELRCPEGRRWAVCILEDRATPRAVHDMVGRILSLQAEPGQDTRSIGVVGRSPLPWLLHLLAAGGADASFLHALEGIMDPALQHPQRHADALIREARRCYGETLDISPENLPALDRVVERLRFRGLGSPTCGLQCAVAAWLGCLLTQLAPGAGWIRQASAETSRPHFQMSDQSPVDLIEAAGHLFDAPFTFGIRNYVDALLQRSTRPVVQA